MQIDVAIIGAGPSGLGAAAELARMGVGRVVVIEREAMPGGVPRHCSHSPFGMREFHRIMGGKAYAERLASTARNAGAQIMCGTTVTALRQGPLLELTGPDGAFCMDARAVLLATGTRESSRIQRMIGGVKPGGVLPTGALQAMDSLKQKSPFRRPLIIGTELVSFSALLTCRQAGMRPVAMIESGPRVIARRPAALLPRLLGVPLMLNTTITEIRGQGRVTGATLQTKGKRQSIDTDGILLTGAFRSESALPAACGIAGDPGSTGPVIDAFGRLEWPGYFAAGNLLRPVETAGACWAEGRLVAHAIAASLTGNLPERSTGQAVRINHRAIRYAVPQILTREGPGRHPKLQIRVSRHIRGELRLSGNGMVLFRKSQWFAPERRISFPMPSDPDVTSLTLTLVEHS